MNYESTLYTVCTCFVVKGVSDGENFDLGTESS